jgi:DNA-binding NtrC family response regulator
MTEQHHVLVVEDEEYWREDVFREALEDEGYRVQTCSNYGEAVAALDQQTFDLIVVDVNLTAQPGNQDGVRVLEWMTTLGHQSQIVIVSGSKTWAVGEDSVSKFQPLDFIDKTEFDVAEFLDLIENALPPVPSQETERDTSSPCAGSDMPS